MESILLTAIICLIALVYLEILTNKGDGSMSIYYCKNCNKQIDKDYIPLIMCKCCYEDVCLDCISEKDDSLCKECADLLDID